MEENKLERCGFCGRWFRGVEIVPEHTALALPRAELDSAPMGYCPDAPGEQDIDEATGARRYITRDMAIDAGDLSLEGQPM